MRYKEVEYGMNEELLGTSIVKGQLERWKKQKYSLDHILMRLWEIHLIKIKKGKLEEILEKLD